MFSRTNLPRIINMKYDIQFTVVKEGGRIVTKLIKITKICKPHIKSMGVWDLTYLKLSQEKYINKVLEKLIIEDANARNTPLRSHLRLSKKKFLKTEEDNT